MTNLFTRVKEAVENAIDNGYEPLAMSAKQLAEDAVEDIAEAVQAVKDKMSNKND
jgi:hypothetical protein